MHNDLHDRLEYLVNYSSQLIFVSGDSIAQQQRTLESFVFQQHDDTEIAYLTADETMEISDYRRQLCRQLLGQVVGSYVRPLNELLVDLNSHDGPVLIAITQAQYIPDKLLQELWDLVLQSRFAGNKQHLNVLLFAETQWAERAKQWLPAKNTDTPLLISSQSVHTEKPASELDRMIAKRRQAFQAHLAARQHTGVRDSVSLLRRGWFTGLVAAVFLAAFGTMMYWQYGDEIRQLFGPLKGAPGEESTQPVPGSAFTQLIDSEPEQSESSMTQETDDLAPEPDNSLVTTWDDAIAVPTQSRSPDSNNETVAVTTDSEPEKTMPAPTTTPVAPEKQAAAKAEPARAVSVSANPPPEVAPNTVANNRRVAALATERNFLIQLSGLSDETLLGQFLDDNKLNEIAVVYQTIRYGGPWYVVLLNQPFSSSDAARAAIADLPDFNGKQQAFVKAGRQVLTELSVDNN